MHSGAHYRAVARFDPADFVRLALAHKITVFNAPPAAYHRLMTYIEANDIDVSETRLRILGAGSAPLDPLLKERVTSAFRRPLHNGYGITETGPSIAFSRPNSPAPDMSIGPPLPHVETCIIDPKGRAVSIDDVGELWVRGPGLMLGYYKDPAATEAAFRPGGWFASGDLVSEDASGNLHVRGRLKELIIRSGFNVYPAEIESILNNDPSVAASAVVGKNVDGNEEIIAFIQPHRGQQPSIERLRTRLRESLAPYKQPSRIFVLEQLPQTATGKVLKHALVVSPQSESGSDEIADAAGKN
jgi:acyl-CoA synthetase (AMP-forming)/AMP-acid ligase II